MRDFLQVSPPKNPESQGMGPAVRPGKSHLAWRTAYLISPPKNPESHGRGLDVRAGESHLACRTSSISNGAIPAPTQVTLPFPSRNWDRLLTLVQPC